MPEQKKIWSYAEDDESSKIAIPEEMPLLAVRDVVVFPQMILPLFVGRENSVLAIEAALAKERFIFLATQRDPAVDQPSSEEIYQVGTVSLIMRVLKLPDGRLKILVQGLNKARIRSFLKEEPYYEVAVGLLTETPVTEISIEAEALMRNAREMSEKILSLKEILSPELISVLDSIEDPGRLADLVASNLHLKIAESQAILEEGDAIRRLIKVNDYLRRELEVSTMQAKIQSEAKEEIDRTQREYFLREQLRAIKKELGEIDERAEELEEYRQKIIRARMPRESEEEALKQLSRLEQMHPDAAETSMVRTYLDWLVELPWNKSTRDKLDLKEAKAILDADHYDLDKIKDRILEYLSVRKLNKKMKGPILCFVGPPGVGKTSLGQSIARALGRKFTRISLGGIRDEAEIRGHRRTYIGALPGRIIQGLKNAGSNNPVFMMDEIDKIGQDFRGDPAAALLEVLDPEQNRTFSDHYLNLPFDLSKVMFITTANQVDPIPSALLDRMEILRLSGYTEEEKLEIAKKYLLPRQLKENGLNPWDLEISPAVLAELINRYTREAGLRNLEREIGSLCRKMARRIAEGEQGPFTITKANIHRYLGPAQYLPEAEQDKDEVGVAIGLAWTEFGGETLFIEASLMKGKGQLTLTGHLGEVMKESAQAALSYARARSEVFNLEEDFYEKLDIHLHVPAGAIPKDGPSAGVTMATALISALTRIPVRKDVAMTGEITLRGKVLPVGGLKEKALAALRAQIKKIIIPAANKKDLVEIPKNIKRRIKFVLVDNMDQVLQEALACSPFSKDYKRPAPSTRPKPRRPGAVPS
ncbi:MAG: endopeptidase La [Deltaproteobacteria bacterium]|nr:endopeptidase La [Deltaproteobacteria bacterium]MBW1952026.1 endopeptidase La [Deltaproteobacteria bacterium]MBW1986090.1 endopeptidase La [Deltaproteobacteria bacterium]MBW2134224.1 endopeptidase La [Deltaproteobacteria bacterium]